jgi:hypothetical protein
MEKPISAGILPRGRGILPEWPLFRCSTTGSVKLAKATQSHGGAKAEGRMKNDEMAGRAPKATPKPLQCDIKATLKPVGSQLIGTP